MKTLTAIFNRLDSHRPVNGTLASLLALMLMVPMLVSAETRVIDTGTARIEVTGDGSGVTFFVTNLLNGQRVFESAGVKFGSAVVNGASGLSSGTDGAGKAFIHANMTLSTGGSATALFVAEEAGRIRVELSGPSSPVMQESVDLSGDRYYGVWMKYYRDQSSNSVKLDNRGVIKDVVGRYNDAQLAEGARAPFYFTNRSAGVYVQTESYGTEVSFGIGGRNRFAFEGSSMVYHILVASDIKGVLAAHNAVAGPAFLPPDWGLGAMWWRDDAHNTENSGLTRAYDLLMRDADQLIQNRIPATGMLIDRPYGTGGEGWGNYDFDTEVQPPGTSIVQALDAKGLKTVLWIANRLNEDQYWEAENSNGLYKFFKDEGWMPAADLRDPTTFAWFRDKLAIFTTMGVGGFKIDRGGEGEMPDSVNNENVRLFGKAASESFGSGASDAVIYARDAFDGSRRYVGIWNGDPPADMGGLVSSIRHGVRAGLINFPFYGTDGGGYYGSTPTRDYWCRAMAVAAYLPMMNVHLGPYRTPWDYWRINGWDAEVLSATSKFAREHHALVPYVRSALAANLVTGLPVVRAMFIEYPEDASLADRDDQYLYGDHLLVAPVTTSNRTSETVDFPGTHRWVNYNDLTTVYQGGTTVSVPAPLDVIPVFAREGAIITRGDIIRGNQAAWTSEWEASLSIDVFPSDSTTGRADHWNGSALVELKTWIDGNKVRFTSGSLGLPSELAFRLGRFHAFEGSIQDVKVNGVSIPSGTGWMYDAAAKSLFVAASTGANDIEITFSTSILVTINEPAENVVANGPLNFSGTASAAEGISVVRWRVDGGAWQTASGTTAWSFTLPRQASGTHVVEVRAEVPGGLLGASQTRTVISSAPVSGPLISGVSVSSGRAWAIDTSFDVGDSVYTDRSFTWNSTGALQGATLIQLANDDKNSTASPYLAFDLGAPAEVIVLYDTRGIPPAGSLPSWMSQFQDAGETLSIQGDGGNAVYRTFSARYAAGPIQLGGNKMSPAAGARSNYAVAVRALEGFEAFQVASFSRDILSDPTKESTHYGWLADPDNDLMANIEEYGFGGSANLHETFQPATISQSGSALQVTLRRAIGLIAIEHQVEISANLVAWTTYSLEELGATVVNADLFGDGLVEEVQFSIPVSDENTFVRIRTARLLP